MKGTNVMQVLPELLRLAEGMVRNEPEAVLQESASENLAVFDALLLEEVPMWGMVVLLAAGAIAWGAMGWMWWKRRSRLNRDLAKWAQLAHYLDTGLNRSLALAELEQIELISSLLLPEADNAHNDWFQLSSSEKQVARGILNDRSAQVLAQEMRCTPSHIYNLRSSIRKKWGVESNQALLQAISERMPKDR